MEIYTGGIRFMQRCAIPEMGNLSLDIASSLIIDVASFPDVVQSFSWRPPSWNRGTGAGDQEYRLKTLTLYYSLSVS